MMYSRTNRPTGLLAEKESKRTASQTSGATIFLPERETERIRNTVKNRLRECSQFQGQKREPRDSKAAISQATGASLMADMGGANTDKLPALAVGQPYPPCIVSTGDLKPIKLDNLHLETHHRGYRLNVKRVSPVVTLAARSWTMVQDEDGNETERLELCLHKSRYGEENLESSSNFVIKEPYFTLSDEGEATLRIDHPSDLIICRDVIDPGSVATINELNCHAEDAAAAEKIARTYKDEGNTALKQQDLPLAHAKYTEGLKVARQNILIKTKSNGARDLSRNRAHVNLLLNRFDEAKSDAQASLISGEDERSRSLDSKAFYRAGRAAYSIGEYQEARGFFQEQLKLAPGDKEGSVFLRRIASRLGEQEIGVHSLTKIRLGLSRDRPRVDAADFFGNTEIRDSPGRGRGLYATRSLSTGEIIMCEKAFCVVWGHENEALTAVTYDIRDNGIRVSPVGLTKSTVEKLLNNPSQIGRVMDLYDYSQSDGKNTCHTADGPIVDVFRVHDIISRNAFGPGDQFEDERAGHASTGLWIRAAYINHSCIPNATKQCVGDLMILLATQPIGPGEEIFHAYDESSDFDKRSTALMTTWGFECDCKLCKAEKADDPAVRKKRQQLKEEVDVFLDQEHWSHAKRLTIVKAQRLVRAIEETYDGKRYEGLPRVATIGIREWITKANPRR